MPRFINASGRTVAQPNGEDWADGVTLSQWSEKELAALLAYGHVVPVPFQIPAAPSAPAPAPAPEPEQVQGEGQGQNAPDAEGTPTPKRRATRSKEPQ